jgi:hypothetical protein
LVVVNKDSSDLLLPEEEDLAQLVVVFCHNKKKSHEKTHCPTKLSDVQHAAYARKVILHWMELLYGACFLCFFSLFFFHSSMALLNIAEYPVCSLVQIVADLLESIIETNDKLIHDTAVTHFHSRAIPNISVHAYLSRILKFTLFSNEVLLSLLIYFDRIVKLKKTKYAVNSYTVHRLLITRYLKVQLLIETSVNLLCI